MKLAVIGGDGIGPEVTAEALKVLNAVRDDIEVTDYDLGARRYLRNGELLADADLVSLREHDAILLGAIGAPGEVPPGVLERGLLLKMRFALDHHVNLRPSKLYPTATSPLANPGDIDFVVVREGTEGLYCGNGGTLREGTPHEIASEVSQNTRYGVERVVRDALSALKTAKSTLRWCIKPMFLLMLVVCGSVPSMRLPLSIQRLQSITTTLMLQLFIWSRTPVAMTLL